MRKPSVSALSFATVSVVAGSVLVFVAFAAGPFVGVDVAGGQLSGGAAIHTSSSAIGGKYVQFGSASASSTPTSTPTPSGGTPTPTPTPTHTPVGIQHVVWIAMEDQNYSDVIGSSSAPYENQLANTYGLATNFYGTTACGGDIVSEPNWLAVTSGQTWGVCDDDDPSSHQLSGANIFSQLPGGAAVAWNESMPSNCYQTNSGKYAPRHNPWTFYTNARTDCDKYDTAFSPTSGNYSVPNPTAKFTFIDPNLNDDTHDTDVATGDSFLSRYIPGLMNTANYKAGNMVIFITHDYSNDTSGHIETVVISPFTHAIKDNTKFNHYSLLLTTEQLLGLPCIANSCSATTMVGHFGL